MHIISKVLIRAFNSGNKVLIIGNGGSSMEAGHFAAELLGKFEMERKALPAISLSDNTAAMTAIANDYGYPLVFSRQIEALGKPGDVLVILSTSGKSANCLAAEHAARNIGMDIIKFPERGILKTAECQELHLKLLHRICREVEETMFL